MTDELKAALFQAVDEAFESEQVPFFERLVNQPSHTFAKADVEAAAAIVDEQAARAGLLRTLVPDPEGVYADHRVFSTEAADDSDLAIALVGHCDTVYPRSSGFLSFSRDAADSPSKGDHVRGPGVLDMKSGLSVILFGLQALQRAAPEILDSLKVRFVCNTDEEVGSPSSRTLYKKLAPVTSMALVFEGGRDEDRVITARKGTGRFTLTAIGREAHAGLDHASGINAIHALSLLVPRVEALTDYDRGTTVNVGTIEGGTAKNTVPGRASIGLDVRVTGVDEGRQIEAALHEIALRPFEGMADAPERFRDVEVHLEGSMNRPAMEPTAKSQKLRELYEKFAGEAGLGVGEAPLQGGGSDGCLLSADGVPTIDGLGPYGKFFHSPREWSSLSSLARRTKALACFLASEPEL
jgi:glutamate carboxypeptidase